MIAQRYGAVPLVRATGGLKDTVQNYAAASDGSTGFVFDDYSGAALLGTIRWAVQVSEDPERWQGLQRRGMAQDFSWDKSAREYEDLYQKAIEHRKKEAA